MTSVRRAVKRFLLVATVLVLAGCAHSAVPPAAPEGEQPSSTDIVLAEDTVLRPLTSDAWLVTTFRSPQEPANAVLVASADRSVLLDTGWSPAQAARVVAWARDVLGRPIGAAMITSPDEDRAGGAPALTAAGVPVFASLRTAALLAERGHPITSSPIEPESIPEVHWGFARIAPDPEAIVAYHAATHLVFAGRFIDALAADHPTREDDLDRLGARAAFDMVAAAFPDAAIVVPGRGEPGTLELLEHSRMLFAECHADAECTVLFETLDTCACCRCTDPRAISIAFLESETAMQPSCDPICEEPMQCPPCATPEQRAALHAVCTRGECTLP